MINIEPYDNTSVASIYRYAKKLEGKTLRDILPVGSTTTISKTILRHGTRKKGIFGNLVEEYIFGYAPNSDPYADFDKVNMELKTTPLKRSKNGKLVSKERLVFSMINYMEIINETWENSTFLKKNKLLLLLFYLYMEELSVLDYEFKMVKVLDLLSGIPQVDIVQIKKDWETIVNKIKEGKAHLLSEADTLYLGAATKSRNSRIRREQPNSDKAAKPRAFAFKQSYLNSLVRTYLKEGRREKNSLLNDPSLPMTIEENIKARFDPYCGMTNIDIEEKFGITYEKKPKNHRRLLVNKIFGMNANKILELEKANITLRVIALEPSGNLKESISFPAFDYQKIIHESWEGSELYEQLTTKRFLFIVFRKTKNGHDIFEKIKFWNFPLEEINNAEWVWQETINRIKNKKADNLPTIKENPVIHVRPHARNKQDTIPTGYGTSEVKKSFWLNAKYIQDQINSKDTI